MASITLSGVKKIFGNVQVIHDLNLEIDEGEFVALVGPSGCGKSTTLRLIAGLDDITDGEIAFDGERVNEKTPLERQISMVFQTYALYPHLTVRKNLSFGLENLRMPRPEINRRVAEVSEMLELTDYLDRKPKALSGGQRQRVAIGRAIVRNPKVFLFDEPLSNLDAKLRVQTRGEISRLHRQLKTTMIYVTHDQVEAMTMAQKIVVMNAGRIEQVGTPLELFDHPANLFVAGFIGSPRMNLYEGEVASVDGPDVQVHSTDLGDIIFPDVAAPRGLKVKIGVRPSHFSAAVPVNSSGSQALLVDNVESLGHETYVYGRLNGGEAETIIHIQNHFPTAPGETVLVAPQLEHVHLFNSETGRLISGRVSA